MCAAGTLTGLAEPSVLTGQRPAPQAERRGEDAAAHRDKPGGLDEPAPLRPPAVPGRRLAERAPPDAGGLPDLQAHAVLARACHAAADGPRPPSPSAPPGLP